MAYDRVSKGGMIVDGRNFPRYRADVGIRDGRIETIGKIPTGDEWRRIRRADGYRHILVNGEATFVDGKETGVTPGRLLRHGRG